MSKPTIQMADVRANAAKNPNGAWVVVKGKVYNFTDFAKDHPGGPELLQKNNGKDATEEFVASHPEDIIFRTVTPEQYDKMYVGNIDPSSMKPSDIATLTDDSDGEEESAAPGTSNEAPSLDTCLNLYDFEAIASRTMKKAGWAYYSSGADDEITLRENHSAFHRIWLRPRVMVNVKEIDMKSKILGYPTSAPLYLSAAAMCKLGHPDGECSWTRAAGKEGIIQMIPTLSSCSLDDIMGARIEGQTVFFQLYVNSNRDTCRKIVEKAERLGCKVMFITCDAPQLGNREKDRRVKVSHSGANVQSGKTVKKSEGTAKALTTFIDPSLNWADIAWFRSITKMKIVLKGIATAEDAVLAVDHNIPAIVLSNHGGRQLDFARSGIEILPEVMQALRENNVSEKIEVFIDGGVRRGTDIFKALALGAKAVGLSRPALYAMSAFGQAGVEKMIQILKDELEMTMRLMGTPTIADIRPEMVVTSDLGRHNTIPRDWLQHETYLPKATQAANQKFTGRRVQNARLENYVQSSKDALALGSGSLSSEVKALREEVKELKSMLGSIAQGAKVKRNPGAFSADTLVVMLTSVLGGIAQTIFVLDSRMSIHRTALILLAFLVVHVFGNLTFFGGQDAFNTYANFMNGLVIIKWIEAYLLVASVLHVSVALFRAMKTKVLKGATKAPMSVFKRLYLLLTGFTILAFVWSHLFHFKLNPLLDNYADADGHVDFYTIMVETFSDDTVVIGYTVSVLTMGLHLYFGWSKAVHKMQLDAAHGKARYLHPVRHLGYACALAVTTGFVAVILASRFVSRDQ